MSLYESFLLLNMFRMLLHSSSGASGCMWVYCSVSVCTGVLVRFGWSRVVSDSSRTAPIHQYTETEQYTYIQSPAPEDECNSIRNMLSDKETFIK